MADRFNTGKPRLSLVPPEFLFALVDAFSEGVAKYKRDNWRTGAGLVWSEVYDSAERHMLAWLAGEDIDPTSGTSHLAKAAWNMLVLDYYRQHPEKYGTQDDRYQEDKPGLAEAMAKACAEASEKNERDRRTLESAAREIINERIADATHGPAAGGTNDKFRAADVFGQSSPQLNDGFCDECPGSEARDPCTGCLARDHRGDHPAANADVRGVTILEDLQKDIAAWADSVFPNRTAHGALTKLMLEEIPELIASKLLDPTEYADIVILVLDIAHLKGIDIGQAVRDKMEINRGRIWKVDPETGLMNHVTDRNFHTAADGRKSFFVKADPARGLSSSSNKWHTTDCAKFSATTDRNPDIFFSSCVICANQNLKGGMCASELSSRGIQQ